MKGVSSVIAIILILMIVVALAALAYTWFTGIFASLTATTSTAVTTTTTAMATSFRIEAVKYAGSSRVDFTIRNIGTQSVDLTKAAMYIKGYLASGAGGSWDVSAGSAGSWSSGATAKWNATNISTMGDICSQIFSVTLGTGLTDSRSITC